MAYHDESVRDFANGRWGHILKVIGVDETVLDGEHRPCPACGGKDRFRFDNLEGRGTWICNSCGAGDGIQLVMRITGLNFARSAKKVEDLLARNQFARDTFKPKPDSVLIRERLNSAWRSANAPLVAANYLKARGLTALDDIKDVRGHSALELYENKVYAGAPPAMLSMIRSAAGVPVCIHRTYIVEGRRVKKMMQTADSLVGSAIRLKDPVDGKLVVGEGIETTLAGMEMFGGGAWALLNAGNMKEWAIPETVNHLVVCADNDASFVGQEAAFTLARRAASLKRGVEVEVYVSVKPGADMLDERRGSLVDGSGGVVRYGRSE